MMEKKERVEFIRPGTIGSLNKPFPIDHAP
jgi:hypothetical protein